MNQSKQDGFHVILAFFKISNLKKKTVVVFQTIDDMNYDTMTTKRRLNTQDALQASLNPNDKFEVEKKTFDYDCNYNNTEYSAKCMDC